MKLHNKISIFAILLIVSSGLVSASPAALNLFPERSSARIDSFTSYELEVENTGPVKDVYTLSSSSASEVTIAPQQVEVQPGETQTANVWFNPRTDRDEGTYTFEITATSRANGDRFSETGTVEVITDHEVMINTTESRTACLGENTVYTLEVTNTGIQPEEFSISSDFGQLSRNSLSLEDGETAEVTLTLSSNTPVERSFEVVSASKTSYAQDIQNIRFRAENCFDSEVSVTPQNREVAAFNEAEFQVTVRNLGTRDDTFTLSASQGELSDTEIEVGSGNTAQETVEITPQQLGTQNLQVTASGNSESSATATLNVYNGMNSEVSFEEEARNICENSETDYEITVENTGEAEETFSLSSSYGELEDSEVEVEAGGTEEVDLEVNSSRGVGTHTIEVTSTASTFGEPSTTSSSRLVVENCWDLEMNVIPEVASAGENRSAIYRIDLNNTGTRENTYYLSHEGPSWIDIRPEEVSVEAGESESAYMYAGIPFQKKGEVEITATAVGNQIERSQTVRLVIGEDIEDAIEDEENNVTGSFIGRIGSAIGNLVSGGTATVVLASVVIGLLITLLVYLRS